LLEPIGRSVYNGLQMTMKSNLKSPVTGVKNLNVQVAYSLSRFISQARDVISSTRLGQSQPQPRHWSKWFGPQASTVCRCGDELPFGTRVNFITHLYSALPQNIAFTDPGNPEDLFQYDMTGDGLSAGKPVPGSNLGHSDGT